jgi:Na+/H+-dicarboxylate symporter
MAIKFLRNYCFPLVLILAIVLGGITGYYFGHVTPYLKPFGDIFLNLIFTAIVPLIFLSISSAVAKVRSIHTLGRIFSCMAVVFLFTGFIAAISSLFFVILFPPAQGINIPLTGTINQEPLTFINHIAGIFTVPDFSQLFSHQHMLALIVFALLVGLSAQNVEGKASPFAAFLQSGEQVFMRVFDYIMYYAPIGFFAYFAVMVHDLGPQIMGSYLRVAILYYSFGLVYFVVALTAYAYIANKSQGVKTFWSHVFLPTITAISTCSSAASIPANLQAAKRMGVRDAIYETSIPLGSMIHKDGSVIGGIFKIAFLFGLFHLDFSGASVLLTAIGISLLVGTVMGAIPSGGMLGELLILNLYGFPPSVLIAVAAISIIIDPLATMINVTSNTVSSMMVDRFVK